MNILFVCSSNICRSPFCEYVFRDMVEKDPELAARVDKVASAAVFNRMYKIHPMARVALLREGFDAAYIDSHKPSFKWGDRRLFDEADLIVGMSRANKFVLPLRYHRKFVTLSEYAEGRYEKVPDPFLMKNVDDYLAVMDFLKEKLQKFAQKIRSLPIPEAASDTDRT